MKATALRYFGSIFGGAPLIVASLFLLAGSEKSLAAAPHRTGSVAESAPSSAPAVPLGTSLTLTDVIGTFIEVVPHATGYARTTRCGPEDQLIFAQVGSGLSMRWAVSPKAREYPDAVVVEGKVVLKDRRRTISIERLSTDVLRLTFGRSDGERRSYLFGRYDFALRLPQVKAEGEGCTF